MILTPLNEAALPVYDALHDTLAARTQGTALGGA